MGTDRGSDTTIDHHLDLDLDVAALDAELGRVVAGLRRGDLAYVVTAVQRLGPALDVCLAAVGVAAPAGRVIDVAFALADLAAEPATADWSAGELMAAAVEQVAVTPVA